MGNYFNTENVKVGSLDLQLRKEENDSRKKIDSRKKMSSWRKQVVMALLPKLI